jgi:hypothetical protein
LKVFWGCEAQGQREDWHRILSLDGKTKDADVIAVQSVMTRRNRHGAW